MSTIVLSALAVPDAVDRLGHLVSEYCHILKKVTSQQNIELLRHIGQLGSFAGYEDAQIWETVEAKQLDSDGTGTTSPASLKVPEWRGLSNPAAAPSARDFTVRTVAAHEGYAHLLKQVVLGARLRETRKLI